MGKENKATRKAEKLVAQGKLELAIEAYQEVLRDSPEDTGVLNALGDLYVRVGNGKEAIPCFIRTAKHFERDGFRKKAIAVLRKAYRQNPAASEIVEHLAGLHLSESLVGEAKVLLMELARNQTQLGKTSEARRTYGKILAIDPDHIPTLLKLSEIASASGDREAEFKAYVALGEKLARAGRVEEAIKMLQQAHEVDPSHQDVATLLEKLKRGDFESGADLTEDTQRHDRSRDSDALSAMGQLALQTGDSLEATKLFQQAVSLDPEDEQVLLLGAAIARSQGDVETCLRYCDPLVRRVVSEREGAKVVQFLEEAAAKFPDSPGPLRRLERVYTALRDKPKLLAALERLSDALESQRDYHSAVDAARRLLDLEPEKLTHKSRLERLHELAQGATLFDDGAAQPAPEALPVEVVLTDEQKAETVSEDVNRIVLEAEILLRYGLREKAKERIRDGIEEFPNAPELYESLGKLHLDDSENTAALNALATAISLYDERRSLEKVEELKASIADAAVGADESAAVSEEAPEVRGEAPAPDYAEATAGAKEQFEADEIGGKLKEAEFYLEQGFFSPALQLLQQMREANPDNPEVSHLWERLRQEVGSSYDFGEFQGSEEVACDAAATPDADDAPQGAEDSLETIASELEKELYAVHTAARRREEKIAHGERTVNAERILSHVTADVADEMIQEDLSVHFDLAMAYQETGLIEEAIIEFQITAEDPALRPKACLHLGMCFRQKGMDDVALQWLQGGLQSTKNVEERADIILQAALIFRSRGNIEQYKAAVEKLKSISPNHPGLAALRAGAGK